MERLGVPRGLYLTMLKEYVKSFDGFSSGLRDILRAGDFDQARIKAHSMKGAAGNIGADELAAVAGRLELVLTEENPAQAEKELVLMEKALQRVLHDADIILDKARV